MHNWLYAFASQHAQPHGHINKKSGENMLEKTKKVAEYCFKTQEVWEKIWEKESLEKLKAELDKTPLPPKGKRHD